MLFGSCRHSHLVWCTILLVLIFFILCDQVESAASRSRSSTRSRSRSSASSRSRSSASSRSRSSASSRSRSRSESRSSSSSSRSSSSRSRSRSRSRSGSSGGSSTKPIYKKLPSKGVKLPSLKLSKKPFKSSARAIKWGLTLWTFRQAHVKLGRYLRSRCRDRVGFCSQSKETVYDDYCQYFLHETDCLKASCSRYERRWLEKVSCSPDDFSNSTSSNVTTGWMENEPLQISLELVNQTCQSTLESCRMETFPDPEEGSYCALLTDYTDCIVTDGNCSQDEWDMLNDAACSRSVVDFEEVWPASEALRMASAVTREACQINVQDCKVEHLETITESGGYCTLFISVNQETCASEQEYCTDEEWDDLREQACYISTDGSGGGAGSLGDGRIVIQAVLLALLVCVSSF